MSLQNIDVWEIPKEGDDITPASSLMPNNSLAARHLTPLQKLYVLIRVPYHGLRIWWDARKTLAYRQNFSLLDCMHMAFWDAMDRL